MVENHHRNTLNKASGHLQSKSINIKLVPARSCTTIKKTTWKTTETSFGRASPEQDTSTMREQMNLKSSIIYQPEAVTLCSDGSASHRPQVSSCNFGAAKINVTAVAYLGVKCLNNKEKNKHLSRRWISNSCCLTAKSINNRLKSKNGTWLYRIQQARSRLMKQTPWRFSRP